MLTAFFLGLSILAAWLPGQTARTLGIAAFIAFLGHGLFAGDLTSAALLPLLLLCGGLAILQRLEAQHGPAPARLLVVLGVTALSLALFSHQLAGFHNLLLGENIRVSPRSTPYTPYINFDKPAFGALYMLIFGGLVRPTSSAIAWRSAARGVLYSAVAILPLVVAGLALGYLAFDPKLPEGFLLWSINNLCFVIVAEECFFRHFVQTRLERLFGAHLGLAVAALLFGLAHLKGGVALMALAALAGWAYGLAFRHGGNLLGAVACHFFVNLIHILWFTYPALAR